MPGSERQREIRRRRKRRKSVAELKASLPKASASDKVEIVRKLRGMTPGAEVLIKNWELTDAQ